MYPKKYVPKSLTKKDKSKQKKELEKSKKKNKKTVKKFLKKSDIYSPYKYYEGLTLKAAKERYKRIKKGSKTKSDDKKSYKPFKTDFRDGNRIKTKTSNYTKEFKKIFPNANSLEDKSKVTGVPLSYLKKVYNKGLAAWRTGHRPGATGQQWGYARVHSFLMKGKTFYTADSKLANDSIKNSKNAKKWFDSVK